MPTPRAFAREPRGVERLDARDAGDRRARASAFQLPTTRSISASGASARDIGERGQAPSADRRCARAAAAGSRRGGSGRSRRRNGRATSGRSAQSRVGGADERALARIVDLQGGHARSASSSYRHAIDHHAQVAVVGRAEHLLRDSRPALRSLSRTGSPLSAAARRKLGAGSRTCTGWKPVSDLDTCRAAARREHTHHVGRRRRRRAAAVVHPQSHERRARPARARSTITNDCPASSGTSALRSPPWRGTGRRSGRRACRRRDRTSPPVSPAPAGVNS